MAALPYMKMYWADYLADTAHLSAIEHGGYLLLIAHYWRTGSLPDDEAKLARIARMSVKQWRTHSETILAFFPEGAHKRIDKERDEARSKSEKNVNSALKRWNDDKNTNLLKSLDADDANALPTQSERIHISDIRYQISEDKKLSLSETSSDARVLGFPEKAKQDRPKRQRHAYSAAFEEFWQAYPTDPLMSKAQAAKQFERLSDEDQRRAISAIPGFRTHCQKNPDYRPVHAERFISQRRFDGFARGSPEAIPFDPIAHQANLDRILGRTKANA